MPTIRPVTLDCHDTAPNVAVRQQEHPLGADEPECWITTVTIGSYPTEMHLVFQTDTPAEGVDLVADTANALFNACAALFNTQAVKA